MSLPELAEKQIPFMRRYARAVLGDAGRGDACVEELLEDIFTDALNEGFDNANTNKTWLFGQLDQALAELDGNQEGKRARRALLLTSMERFSNSQAASVLGVDDTELKSLLQSAERDMVNALATRLLIIEDEPLIGAHLCQIAEDLGHKVVGIATTSDDAVTRYSLSQPDIILADIQLADGSLGTDAIAKMDLADSVPVVFVTAYPEQMLRTREQGPTYLITKPFQPDYVKAIVSHALIRANENKFAA